MFFVLEALRHQVPPAEWAPPVSAALTEPPAHKRRRKGLAPGQPTLTEPAHYNLQERSMPDVAGAGVKITALEPKPAGADSAVDVESTRTPDSTPQSIEQQCDFNED